MVNSDLIILTRYSKLGASSRVRFYNFLSLFHKLDMDYSLNPLIKNEMLQELYDKGNYNRYQVFQAYLDRLIFLFDKRRVKLLWIEKELFPWVPYFIESIFIRKRFIIIDYDDAIFHNYDLNKNIFIRLFLKRKIEKLMRRADLVVAGNAYIADKAITSGAKKVKIIPTAVDPKKYVPVSKFDDLVDSEVRIVWIGSPSTIKYLCELKDVLRKLIDLYNCRLVIIGANTDAFGDKNINFVPWTEGTEAQEIASCDIGIMPIPDAPFERGKCGYKLLQYMSCSLPVVASPVGVNTTIVEDGMSGFVPRSQSDWFECLEKLIQNKKLRESMGAASREKVRAFYSIQFVFSELEKLFAEIIKKTSCAE